MSTFAKAPDLPPGSVPDSAWVCRRHSEIGIYHWPDGSIVFDDASGQLQCLSPVAGTIMANVARGGIWTTALLAQELLGEEPTAHDVEMMENVLAEFSSLNFIERVAV